MITSSPRYLNAQGWSDVTPFEVLSITPSGKTAIVREMKAERDPSWTPIFISGGFADHCVDNKEQKWIITPDADGFVTKVRLTKKGWKSVMGCHVASDKPVKFYDFNF